MLHVLEHTLIDAIKLLPFLFIAYLIIELIEQKAGEKTTKLIKKSGKFGPVLGSLLGIVPQCGFSVISSELYSKRKISIAALIAVFIATSDEAIPLMLSNYKTIPALLILITTKIIFAIGIGYLTLGLYKIFFKKPFEKESKTKHLEHHENENHDNKHNHEHDEEHEESSHENESHIHACCHHDLKDNKFDWKHPLVHSIKISLYIFIINFILGGTIELLGEDKLSSFLSSSKALQPIFALLIGLIPNCASSVVLTELYLIGGLSFGSIITGLSVNAGLGILVLFKENKNKKENLFIILMLIIPSLIFGYILHYLPLNFLSF